MLIPAPENYPFPETWMETVRALNAGGRVRLRSGTPFILRNGDAAQEVTGHVEFSVTPTHEVTVLCDELGDIGLSFHWSSGFQIESDAIDIAADVIVKESRFSSEPGQSYLRLKPNPQNISVGNASQMLDSMDFGVLNFPLIFQATPERDRSPEFAVTLGDWRVSMWEAPGAREPNGAPAIPNGFLVSHVGRIRRADEAQFSIDQSTPVVDSLQWALSFISGRMTCTVLDTGGTGNMMWRNWSAKVADSYKFVLGAGLRGTDASVAAIMQGFCNRHLNESKALSGIVYWYCKSNLQAVGADGSLVLAQTGLEKLSWHVLVDTNEVYTVRRFERLSTGEKMQALVNHCLGDPTIPDELANLVAFSNENERCSDGPSAINQIRNEIIHPRRRFEGRLPIAEAWHLALSYLELCLLHHIGYDGMYLNRLQSGGAKRTVPWA